MPEAHDEDMKEIVVKGIDPTKFKGHQEMYEHVCAEAMKQIPPGHAISGVKMSTVTTFDAVVKYHKGVSGASFGAEGKPIG
jgi:hypothetical protein